MNIFGLKITNFIKSQGSTPAIQIAHAGRKASKKRPWQGRGKILKEDGGWIPKHKFHSI